VRVWAPRSLRTVARWQRTFSTFRPVPRQITSRVDVVTTDGSEPPRALLEAACLPPGPDRLFHAFTADSSSLGVSLAPGGAVQQVSLNGGLRTLAPPGTSTVCRHDCPRLVARMAPLCTRPLPTTASTRVRRRSVRGLAEMGFIEAIDAPRAGAPGARSSARRTRLPDEFSNGRGPWRSPRGATCCCSPHRDTTVAEVHGPYLCRPPAASHAGVSSSSARRTGRRAAVS